MSFPKGFLWGGSISAAQIEGGWNEGGKSPVLVDYCTAGSAKERRQIWYLDQEGKKYIKTGKQLMNYQKGVSFSYLMIYIILTMWLVIFIIVIKKILPC